MCDPRFPSTARVLGYLLSEYMNHATGEMWPSHSRLSKDLGACARIVSRYMNLFESLGFLYVVRQQGRGGSNLYRLTLPPLPADGAPAEGDTEFVAKADIGSRVDQLEGCERPERNFLPASESGTFASRRSHFNAEKEDPDFTQTINETYIEPSEERPRFSGAEHMFFIPLGSEAFEAWQAHERKIGHILPFQKLFAFEERLRDGRRRLGTHRPTLYPPDYEVPDEQPAHKSEAAE
jgi:hypothetical protein